MGEHEEVERMSAAEMVRELELWALDALNVHGPDYGVHIGWVARTIGVDREMARALLRGLRSTGDAVYSSGLMDEDGILCGSGYSITVAGQKRLAAALTTGDETDA